MVKVLSVGGSIVAPNQPDSEFLISFEKLVRQWLKEDATRKLILVVGGGAPARTYQQAYRAVLEGCESKANDEQADWIGIMATRLNAQLLKAIFGDLCVNDVVYDPTQIVEFSGRILWLPVGSQVFRPITTPFFLQNALPQKLL